MAIGVFSITFFFQLNISRQVRKTLFCNKGEEYRQVKKFVLFVILLLRSLRETYLACPGWRNYKTKKPGKYIPCFACRGAGQACAILRIVGY
jgi:hypothetical protein